MKLALTAIAVLAAPLALTIPTSRPQGTWQPFQFRGNERFDYKLVVDDAGTPKETGFGLDIRKKNDGADFDVTWSFRSTIKKEELNDQAMLGYVGAAPVWAIMHPVLAAFVTGLELKEGEKMSFFGAGVVKVTSKATVGGRTGFVCQYFEKADDGEKLAWEWVVDPELALPIRSVIYDSGRETSRSELTGYKRD